MSIRVDLSDDHTLIRAALQMVITDAPDVETVGQAGTGDEAVRHGRHRGHPAHHARPRTTRVVMLITFDEDDHIYGALRAAASGFLRDMGLDDILDAVRIVAAGDGLIAPSVTRRLIEEFAGGAEPAPPAHKPDGIGTSGSSGAQHVPVRAEPWQNPSPVLSVRWKSASGH